VSGGAGERRAGERRGRGGNPVTVLGDSLGMSFAYRSVTGHIHQREFLLLKIVFIKIEGCF